MIAFAGATIAEIGEKRLLREVIRPLFNPERRSDSVGDDCALIEVASGRVLCASTNHVSAELIAFRLGLIDYAGLGRSLTALTLSDIAACGDRALALLLATALPSSFRVDDLVSLLTAIQREGGKCGVQIKGGDLSASSELSLSCTALGEHPSRASGCSSTSRPISSTLDRSHNSPCDFTRCIPYAFTPGC
jgi:thiamine-monophosphate kinase